MIERLQRAFHPSAAVERNAKLQGRISNRLRQIDIAIQQTFGPQTLLIIVECKQWRRKIDVKAVEGFAGVMEDVGAHAGIMVSPKGFTAAARTVAKRKQISLYNYRDTKQEAWPNGLEVPIVVEIWTLVPLALYIRRPSGEQTNINSEDELNLRDPKTGIRKRVATVFRELWEKHEPKANGRHVFEIESSGAKGGVHTLVFEGDTKLRRVFRQGRFHFTGLVAEDGKEAHTSGFEIVVEGAPKDIADRADAVQRDHAGLGLNVSTTSVQTQDKASLLVDRGLLEGIFSVQATVKGSIPIKLEGERAEQN